MNNKVAVEVCLVESPARDGEVGSVDTGGRLAVAVGTSVSVTKTGVAKVGLGLSLPLAIVVPTEGGVASDQTSGGDGRGSKNSSGVAGDRDVGGVNAGGRLGDGDGGASVAKTKTRVASSQEQGVSLSGDQGGGANH